MKDQVLEDIKNYAVKRLKEAYGYCGLAARADMAMINSDDKNGNEIQIRIESRPK